MYIEAAQNHVSLDENLQIYLATAHSFYSTKKSWSRQIWQAKTPCRFDARSRPSVLVLAALRRR